MWYFAWILGLGLALAFAILNGLWHEFGAEAPAPRDGEDPDGERASARVPADGPA